MITMLNMTKTENKEQGKTQHETHLSKNHKATQNSASSRENLYLGFATR